MNAMIATLTALLSSLAVSASALADQLILCDGGADDERPYLQPDGTQRSLRIADISEDECSSIDVAARRDDVEWFALIPATVAEHMEKGVGLLGTMNNSEFLVSEVIPATKDQPPSQELERAWPVDEDLLQMLDITTFGIEERVLAQSGPQGVAISCRDGSQPAGVLLSIRDRGQPAGAELSADIAYKSNADFRFGFSDPDQVRQESPRLIGSLPKVSTWETTKFMLPTIEMPGRHAFSILCPTNRAELTIQRLVLRPADDARAQCVDRVVVGTGEYAVAARLRRREPEQRAITQRDLAGDVGAECEIVVRRIRVLDDVEVESSRTIRADNRRRAFVHGRRCRYADRQLPFRQRRRIARHAAIVR